VSGIIALADQGRTTPLSSSQLLTDVYSFMGSNYSTDFHDVTSGNNGLYYDTAGYDLVTGIGSLQANNLVPALTSY
jgi:hypothetical protein